jgi:hypothetical protein
MHFDFPVGQVGHFMAFRVFVGFPDKDAVPTVYFIQALVEFFLSVFAKDAVCIGYFFFIADLNLIN